MKEAAEPHLAPQEGLGAHLARFFTSSIGAKVLMAITGLGLLVFIVGHLAGNLLVLGGPDTFNGYAAALKSRPVLLWTARVGLIALFVIHIVLSLWTKLRDREARPIRYAVEATRVASFASRNMLVTGLLILAFLLYHLAHFTLGWTNPADFPGHDPLDPNAPNTVFSMVVHGFRRPGISILYGVAMVLLGLHISHGFSSLFQHLGLWGQRFARWIRAAGVAVAVAIGALFVLIPVSILLGIITL